MRICLSVIPGFHSVCHVWLGIICLLCLGLTAQAAEKKRPNIILIMCDDLGYEGISAYGSETYRTPHLDRLAAGGALLTHCYSQPICTPSRVQIMTGQYNFRNYTQFGALNTNQVTFGNLLCDAGYATAIAGKWQLGGDSQTVKDFGFDNHCLWHLDGRQSRYWNPRIVRDGTLMTDLEESFGPDVMCDYITDFMEQHQDEPFFVYYPALLTHWPFVPTPDSKPDGNRTQSGEYDGKKGGTEYFPDMVNYLDKNVGRIVAKLDELKLRENTLLLFTCDNGSAVNIVSRLNGREIKGGKGTMPDAGTHVAMVASWPGVIPKGQVLDALVDFTDVMPTLAEVAQARLPQDRPLDGQTFMPQLRGESTGGRPWVFCHYSRDGTPLEPAQPAKRNLFLEQQQEQRQAKKLGRFARGQRYKLYDDGRLYDVQQDVLEEHEIKPGKGSSAAEQARAQLQEVHAKMPPWEPFRPRE